MFSLRASVLSILRVLEILEIGEIGFKEDWILAISILNRKQDRVAELTITWEPSCMSCRYDEMHLEDWRLGGVLGWRRCRGPVLELTRGNACSRCLSLGVKTAM